MCPPTSSPSSPVSGRVPGSAAGHAESANASTELALGMTRTSVADPVSAGAAADYRAGDRRIISVGDREVGVFRLEDGFVAYENVCLHQGGPVCSGLILPRLRAVVDEAGRCLQERYDESEPHLVCPWHGWEYDLRTGEVVVANLHGLRLRSFPVRVTDGEVFVDAG
jgi:nitrite reductase (NADH) small subunit